MGRRRKRERQLLIAPPWIASPENVKRGSLDSSLPPSSPRKLRLSTAMQENTQSNLGATRRPSFPLPSLASSSFSSSAFSPVSCSSSTAGDSSPPSLLFSSTSASPSSSLASSPSLDPKRSYAFSPPHLTLDSQQPPPQIARSKVDPTQLTAYAASVIRNEAYALLALASRLAPAASQPFVSDDEVYRQHSGSCGSSEGGYEEGSDTPASMEGVPSPFSPDLSVREETLTNVACVFSFLQA
jgi:hypothetical protein